MMDPDSKIASEITAKLVSRILHDLAGPTSGLSSALDLLADDADEGLHAEAVSLARDSLDRLAERIAFCRAAYGGGLDVAMFHRLAQTPFSHSRATLECAKLSPEAPPLLGQALLILSQISAEALALGGTARMEISPSKTIWSGSITIIGVRAHLHPETALGLAGQDLVGGLPGRWAPARYVNAVVTAQGGGLSLVVEEGLIRLAATLPV